MKKTIQLLILAFSMAVAVGSLADQPSRTVDKSTPKLSESRAAPQTQPGTATPPARMVKKLKARDFDRLLAQHHRTGKPTPSGASNIKAPNEGPQKYIIADCGDGLVCCSYTGSGSTCNLFQSICAANDGQASGDSNEAVCKF